MSCIICDLYLTACNLCIVWHHVPVSDGAIVSAMLLMREPGLGSLELEYILSITLCITYD